MAEIADGLRLGEIQTMSRSEDWRTVYDFWFPRGLDSADIETHYRIGAQWKRSRRAFEQLCNRHIRNEGTFRL